MPQISDWTPSEPKRILVFGKIKLGKTWGACTFPRPVVFDFDKGMATARNPEFVAKYPNRWIYYETFEDTERNKQGVVTKHTGFDEACRFFDEWMKPRGKWKNDVVGSDMFDTFVIDSGTTLSDVAVSKAAIILGAMKLSKTQEQAVQYGLLIPKMQDFGAERSLVEQFVRMVLDSGKNVVLLCHEKEIYEGEGASASIVEILPMFTGKSAQAVPLMFDEVYNLRVKMQGANRVRYLQTQPDALRRCGSRYGIPNETPWEYDLLAKEIEKIHKAQAVVQKTVGATVAPAGALQTSTK